MVRLIIVPWSTEPPQNIVIRVQHKSSSMKREPLFLSLPDFPHNTLNSQSHHHKTPRANRRLSSPQDSYHKALTTTRLLLPQKILLRSLKTLDFQYSKFSKPQIFAFTRKMAMPFRTPAATGVASSSNAPCDMCAQQHRSQLFHMPRALHTRGSRFPGHSMRSHLPHTLHDGMG